MAMTSIYTFRVCLSVCLNLYQIKVKIAKQIRPKFFVGPHMTLGKVLNAQSFKHVSPILLKTSKKRI